MVRLLEEAISEVSKLPENEQEAIGAWLLAEIESERRWDDVFGRSLSVLDRRADEALQENEQGLTTPLDPDQLGSRTRPRVSGDCWPRGLKAGSPTTARTGRSRLGLAREGAGRARIEMKY